MRRTSRAGGRRPWVIAVAAALAARAAVAQTAPMRVTAVEAPGPAKYVAANAPETRADCERFRPSGKQLRAWFARARTVEQPAWLEEGDQSACQLSGVVVTATGARRRFELGRGGMGRVEAGPGAFVYLLGAELPSATPTSTRRR